MTPRRCAGLDALCSCAACNDEAPEPRELTATQLRVIARIYMIELAENPTSHLLCTWTADEASEQLGLDVTAEDVVRAVARETYLRERDRELALAMRA